MAHPTLLLLLLAVGCVSAHYTREWLLSQIPEKHHPYVKWDGETTTTPHGTSAPWRTFNHNHGPCVNPNDPACPLIIVVGAGPAGSVATERVVTGLPDEEVALFSNGYSVPNNIGPTATWWGADNTSPQRVAQNEHNAQFCSIEGPVYGSRCGFYPMTMINGGGTGVNGQTYGQNSCKFWNQWGVKVGNTVDWSCSSVYSAFREIENWKSADPENNHGHAGKLILRAEPSEPFIAAMRERAAFHTNTTVLSDGGVGDGAGFHNTVRNIDIVGGVPIRQNTFDTFVGSLPPTAKLTVYNKATVVGLIWAAPHPGREPKVIGVNYLQDGETKKLYARGEVILTPGVIESSRLLLLSGVGPRSELEAVGVEVMVDQPLVGKGLMSSINLVMVALGNASSAAEPRSLTAATMGTYYSTNAQTRGDSLADMELAFGRIGVTPGGILILIVIQQNSFRFRGSVTLKTDAYPNPPTVTFGFYQAPFTSDADDLVENVLIARKVLRDVGATEISAGTLPFQTPASIRAAVLTSPILNAVSNYHQSGGLAMGSSFATGVVDTRFRVWGISGVRVCDASVAPDIPNDGHNGMDIAHRLGKMCGDFLVEEYQN